MAKKVAAIVKLQVNAGKATPQPPIGPALGQHGVNIMGFCKEFNERTAKQVGYVIPVVITVYSDRSFTFITKTPPVPVLIKKACRHRVRFRQAQPRQGCQADQGSGPRDRYHQDARPQRRFH